MGRVFPFLRAGVCAHMKDPRVRGQPGCFVALAGSTLADATRSTRRRAVFFILLSQAYLDRPNPPVRSTTGPNRSYSRSSFSFTTLDRQAARQAEGRQPEGIGAQDARPSPNPRPAATAAARGGDRGAAARQCDHHAKAGAAPADRCGAFLSRGWIDWLIDRLRVSERTVRWCLLQHLRERRGIGHTDRRGAS